MAARVKKQGNYVGETRKQLREGYGKYIYSNSFYTYEGEWRDGKKHGHGKLLMKDGSYYEGEFIHGEIAGHGTRYWSHNKNTYSGQFENGELEGHGVMTYADSSRYEGAFQRNKREGHGELTDADGGIYEGSFHNNKRHGDGQQTYANGDRYIGDWINGQRQGSGEMHFQDTSLYDGQWRNDMFNGEGTYIGVSGMSYEGIWINGRPAIEADRLVFVGEPVIELVQGTTFNVAVETRNAEGELVEDNGREIQIIAGFRHYTPSEGTPLFNLIEDIEEKPTPTPYGYDVVNYPLTEVNNMKLDERPPSPGGNKSIGNIGDSSSAEVNLEEEGEDVVTEDKPIEGEATENPEIREPPKEETTGETATLPPEGKPMDVPVPLDGDQPEVTGEGQASMPMEVPEQETPVPPPVNTHRSDEGKTSFQDLILPSAPQGYIPFTILDQLEEELRPKSRGKTTNLVAALRLGAKVGRSIDNENVDPTKLDTKENAKIDARLAKQRREKTYGDERFARPGEYVVMAQDVTNPPFLGRTLQPAYMLIKVTNALEKLKPTTKKSKSSTKRSKTNVDKS
ncbi:MORN repeat-containing protein 1-like isoform X3 [Ptychodera flava]|uniref:MORN repeat-containing protein 1-like isoform X3 n=1 Tax=Ptychodera flava TaxID=63121 RepID=UPI00396A47FE